MSYYNFALSLRAAGKPVDALGSAERSLEVRQRLADDHPEVARLQSDLAQSHTLTGFMHNENARTADALVSYGKALAIHQRLADAHPDVPEYQSNLGVTLFNIGGIELAGGRPREADGWMARAVDATRAAFRTNPLNPYYLDCHRFHVISTDQLVSGRGRRGGNVPVALCHL